MMYIGYEYKTANGDTVRKLVACETREAFRKMRIKIIEVGYTLIEFDEVLIRS